MPSKLDKVKKTLASSRRKAREAREKGTNMALTAGAGWGAGYLHGRYPNAVQLGEDEDTGEGGASMLMIGGGLLAAGGAVSSAVPPWAAAIGLGALTGTLYAEGLASGKEDAKDDD